MENQNDPLLLPFLQAKDERDAFAKFQELLEGELWPKINDMVTGKMGIYLPNDSQNEIAGEVVCKVQIYFWEWREDPKRRPIKNLLGYLRTMVKHVVIDFQRRNTNFRQFSDALKYRLRKDGRFSFSRTTKGNLVVCMPDQINHLFLAKPTEQLKMWVDNPHAIGEEFLSGSDLQHLSKVELSEAILKFVNNWLEFKLLASIVFNLKQAEIRFLTETGIEEPDSIFEFLDLASNASSLDEDLEEREFMQALWDEVVSMPVEERRAFLLTKKDVAELFEQCEVVSVREVGLVRIIGGLLQLEEKHFERAWRELPMTIGLDELTDLETKFAELWNKLPLKIEVVATLFDLTVGKVRKHLNQALKKLKRIRQEF